MNADCHLSLGRVLIRWAILKRKTTWVDSRDVGLLLKANASLHTNECV